MNRNDINPHPASPAKVATINEKGKAPCRGHDNPTMVPPTGVRKLPNLAPKPAVINSESHHIFGGDSQRKRARVSDDTQGSPQLLQQIYATMKPMSFMNDAGSHMDNNIPGDEANNTLGFNGPIGGSNIQSRTNDTQRSENHTPATPFDPLPNSHNLSQGETSWSYTLVNIPSKYIYTTQPPSMMSQGPQISDPPGAAQALRICAGCDAMLMAIRQIIYMEVPDPALQMRLLGKYFALRDNWYSCHARGF